MALRSLATERNRRLGASIVDEVTIGESNHSTLSHTLVALLAHLLVGHRKHLLLANDLRLVDVQLQRQHQSVYYLNIVLLPRQPVEHILKERTKVLALHQISWQKLERTTTSDFVRVRIQQLHGRADSNFFVVGIQVDLQQLIVDFL